MTLKRLSRGALAVLCILAIAAGPASLQSVWRARPILVDGSDRDWSAQPGDEIGAFKAAFANDRRDLYILLRPETAQARARLAQGDVMIWLDGTGAGVSRVGVRLRAPATGQSQADRAPDLAGPAAPTLAASVPRSDPIAARMGAGDAGVFEARVPLTLFGTYVPRQLAVGVQTAAAPDASDQEQTAGEGASASPARGVWQGVRSGDDAYGTGGGRYLDRPEGGGRGASLPPADTGPSAVWFRLTLARPAANP